VRQRCLAKGLSLATQLEPVANVWNADARRFKQILLNLLSNAVKFTPSGGHITLRGGLVSAEGLWIEVADNGIGIAEADHERVFQEFHQAGPGTDNPAEGRAEGTGLGLALVRRLVEQHGGRITLHSQRGEGACFRFNIPAATPRSAP
jgi:signal transduction histidine kinase